MKACTGKWRAVVALLLTLSFTAPCFAQQPTTRTVAPQTGPPAAPAAPPKQEPSVTFDTLLAADAYAVYGEVRGLGQYVNSKEVQELLAPLRLPGGAPPEALDLFNFMSRHADELLTARVMFAAMPMRPQLPDALSAVELSSPEEAQKFETALRKFLLAHAAAITAATGAQSGAGGSSSITTPTPTEPTAPLGGDPGSTDTTPPARASVRRVERRAKVGRGNKAGASDMPSAPPAAPFYLERTGTLIVLTEKPFPLAALHPATASLLADEPGFQTARAHFTREALFVYVNTKRIERNAVEQRAKYEREAARQNAEMQRAQTQIGAGEVAPGVPGASMNANSSARLSARVEPNPNSNANTNIARNNADPVSTSANINSLPGTESIQADPVLMPNEPPPPTPISEEKTEAEPPRKLTPEEEAQAQQQHAAEQLLSVVPSLLFGGGPASNSSQWPESIAVAAGFEDDEIVVRALLVNESADGPQRPLPFVPLLLSGPAIAPEAANVVPADTDVFVSASLDLPQMYDYVSSMLKLLDFAASAGGQQKGANDSFGSQIGTFEKHSGFRIKDDLIAALGNEIAVAAPAQWLGVRRGGSIRSAGEQKAHGPIFIIALNDKQAFKALLPRALASVGLNGVSEQQLFEKRGAVELLTFAQGAVALIDRYLVIAPDAATMQQVTEAYNNHTTLATTDAYRNAARWQQRQVLGQVYVSSALLQQTFEDPKNALEDIDDAAVREVLLRLNATPGAITYDVTREDKGLLHELHVPKDLLTLMSADSLISRQLGPMRGREGQAQWALQSIATQEESYKEAHGKYGSLEDLKRAAKADHAQDGEDNVEDAPEFNPQAEGYDIKLNGSGDKFAATATPVDYRKSGRRSFYIDQSGVLRAADIGGRTADAATPPAN